MSARLPQSLVDEFKRNPDFAEKFYRLNPHLRPPTTSQASAAETPKAATGRRPGEMNQWEAKYAHRLETLRLTGEVVWWSYERITIKLADATTYTPDFLVQWRGGRMEFVEVKGFERDDAAVKFKVAADLHRWAEWRMVQLVAGEWTTVRAYPALNPGATQCGESA